VTYGFDTANSPCGLRNNQRNCFHGCRVDSTAQSAPVALEHQRKQSRCRLKNHQRKCFHGWRLDSTVQSTPMASKRYRKLSRCRFRNHLWKCFHGWHMDSTAQTAHRDSEIINETESTCDSWIQQHNQPLGTQKSSTKLLRRVMHGFESASAPVA